MSPVIDESEENTEDEQKVRKEEDERKGLKSKTLSVILGEELTNSKGLGLFSMIVLADFLTFTAIYIPYTHLPPLAKETFSHHHTLPFTFFFPLHIFPPF